MSFTLTVNDCIFTGLPNKYLRILIGGRFRNDLVRSKENRYLALILSHRSWVVARKRLTCVGPISSSMEKTNRLDLKIKKPKNEADGTIAIMHRTNNFTYQ
jgi:hypothetical protein